MRGQDRKGAIARRVVALLLILIGSAEAGNALKDHPSPYLALHGEDPVAWRDWGDDALAEARALNRPLFISSGYFACHWCHVMQRESYRDSAIAGLLNTHFIPVKLDRELNPALDDYLIRFVERTRGQAGWPLNVILSPEGYPLAGLTYLPPSEFRAVLERVAQQWHTRADVLARLAREAAAEAAAVDAAPYPTGSNVTAAEVARALRDEALVLADELGGGFGHQNKFPMEPQLLALLVLQDRLPDERLAAFLRLTLEEMARRGLRDHLAGGFFRYTTDPDWRTPHFEKMLYNQAQLTRVYLTGARVLDEPAFLDVARDTLDFVLTGMAGEDGGFIASLSAVDAAGEEGGSYLWGNARLMQVLTPSEQAVAVAWWSLDPVASPASGLLPQRLTTVSQAAAAAGVEAAEIQRLVPEIRRKLLAERATRPPPRDTKQLAGWNGLLLWALADATSVLQEPRYEGAGARIAGFLRTLWDGQRLHRARDGKRSLGESSLEDYAFVAAGLDAWFRVTGDPADRILAREIAASAWRNHFVPGQGWRLGTVARLPGMPLDRGMHDSALPAPSGVIVQLGDAAGPGSGDSRLAEALALSGYAVREAPFWHATHAVALLYADTRGTLRQ